MHDDMRDFAIRLDNPLNPLGVVNIWCGIEQDTSHRPQESAQVVGVVEIPHGRLTLEFFNGCAALVAFVLAKGRLVDACGGFEVAVYCHGHRQHALNRWLKLVPLRQAGRWLAGSGLQVSFEITPADDVGGLPLGIFELPLPANKRGFGSQSYRLRGIASEIVYAALGVFRVPYNAVEFAIAVYVEVFANQRDERNKAYLAGEGVAVHPVGVLINNLYRIDGCAANLTFLPRSGVDRLGTVFGVFAGMAQVVETLANARAIGHQVQLVILPILVPVFSHTDGLLVAPERELIANGLEVNGRGKL